MQEGNLLDENNDQTRG